MECIKFKENYRKENIADINVYIFPLLVMITTALPKVAGTTNFFKFVLAFVTHQSSM